MLRLLQRKIHQEYRKLGICTCSIPQRQARSGRPGMTFLVQVSIMTVCIIEKRHDTELPSHVLCLVQQCQKGGCILWRWAAQYCRSLSRTGSKIQEETQGTGLQRKCARGPTLIETCQNSNIHVKYLITKKWEHASLV